MAIECAKRGRNLILAALPGELISQKAVDLMKTYRIHVVYFETDLTLDDNIRKFTSWIISKYKVDMLINNAGIGGSNQFEQASSSYMNTIIQLNMRALVFITHRLLPLLKTNKKSYILNIASIAAFSPVPFKTILSGFQGFRQFIQ